jgi:hypothetical protein
MTKSKAIRCLGSYGTHEREKNCIQSFGKVVTSGGKRPLGRRRHRLDGNIKMNVGVVG